jgi:hypothetical protein
MRFIYTILFASAALVLQIPARPIGRPGDNSLVRRSDPNFDRTSMLVSFANS